jgi:hypothetical protein
MVGAGHDVGRGNNWNEREEDLLVVDKNLEGGGAKLALVL